MLSLSDEEFYALTPRQYNLLLKRHEEQVKHTESLMGILAATFANYTANWSMTPPKHGLQKKPAEFMPSMIAEQVRQSRRSQRRFAQKRFNDNARCLVEALKKQGLVVPANTE